MDRLLAGYSTAKVRRFCVPLRGARDVEILAGNNEYHALQVPGLWHPRARVTASRLLWHIASRVQAAQCAGIIRRSRTQVVWSILDYAWLPVTYRLMKSMTVPMHVSIHDDPVESAKIAGWPKDVLLSLDRALEYCLKHARSRDVISEGMAEYYRDRFGVSSVIVQQAVAASVLPEKPVVKGPVRIVHAGNLLHSEEATAFMRALRSRSTGAPTVECFGNAAPWLQSLASEGAAVLHGWISPDELDVRLPEFDYGYLPYGFDPSLRRFVQTSFPTKLITYLKCGLPIIYHGPSYSSVARFLSRYPVGIIIDTNDPQEIRRRVQQLSTSDLVSMRAACSVALSEVFDGDTMVNRWKSLILSAAKV